MSYLGLLGALQGMVFILSCQTPGIIGSCSLGVSDEYRRPGPTGLTVTHIAPSIWMQGYLGCSLVNIRSRYSHWTHAHLENFPLCFCSEFLSKAEAELLEEEEDLREKTMCSTL